MTDPNVFVDRMLEFNFLPSRILHPSRYAAYGMPDPIPAILTVPDWQDVWHKHWSRSILRVLNIETVRDTHHPELALGLLPTASLAPLARRVGAVLCGPALRQTILGPQVRMLRAALGDELLRFVQHEAVQRGAVEYDPGAAFTHDPDTLKTLETLGYSSLLKSVSEARPEVARRIELKLPTDVTERDSPLTVAAARELCLAVLKKTDATWCSFFHATR